MALLYRPFVCVAILTVWISLVPAACFSSETKTDVNAKTVSWHSYSNPKVNFTFKYPNDWEITDDFFYKTSWTINLQRKGADADSDNWIRINPPQFQDEDGVCKQVGEEEICTYSKDAAVLEIFKKVAASFHLLSESKQ